MNIDQPLAGTLGRTAAAVAITAILIMGCKKAATTPAEEIGQVADTAVSPVVEVEKPSTAAETLQQTTAASIPFSAVELPGNKLLAEATAENWESEQIAESAASLLYGLSPLLFDRDQAKQVELAGFVDAKVRVGELRPRTLSPVFRDPTFQVRRPSSALPTPNQQNGPEALATQLKALGEPFQDDTSRYEQKVTRIQLGASEVTTTSLVHLAGKSAEGNLQINLSWECVWSRGGQGGLQLRSIRTTDYEEVLAPATAFTDCTQSALGNTSYWNTVLSRSTDYWLDRLESRYGLDPAAWQGLAVGDVNQDGLDDLYICQAGGIPNGLLIQNRDGTVRDTAVEAGVNLYDQTQSALFVDLDNDGDQDLVVAILMGVTVFANDGQGNFSAKAAKLIPEGMPYSLSAADYDQDGNLDLYACCYSKRKSELDHRFLGRPIPYHDANNGARNALFRNLGDWQFQDVTKQVGLSANNSRFSFAASWEDCDNDGDLDLYVANDYGRNNLYRNDQGTFTDVAADAGVEDMSAGMSVSWGDVDNDGWMDLYVSNMFSSAGNRVTYQRQFKQNVDAATLAGYQRHARGNSLFKNSGDGRFKDVSTSANVTMGRWAWGSAFVDLNNDGLKDVLVTNGFLTQENPDDL